MAKFISDIHEFVNFLTGKGQTGYHSPEEIDNAVHESSKVLYNQLMKVYEETKEISDDLSPFLIGPTSLTVASGQANKPANYNHCVALTATTSDVEVEIVDHSMLASKRNDPLCPPAADYPICTFYSTYIQFYPTNVSNVKITYFKVPTKPEWAYDVDGDDRYEYNDTDSVDIEWKENRHGDIKMKAMEFLGINLREGDLVEFAQIKKQEIN